MKITNYVLSVILLVNVPAGSFAQALDSIEFKIEEAFLELGHTGNKEPIEKIVSELKALRLAKAKNAGSAIHYWYGFALYRYAISTALTDDKRSEKMIDEAIESLDAIENKNSEHYALWSLQKGFALQYANAITVAVQAPKVAEMAKKAIEMNDRNPRAHLALGSYDFYTPTMFGGGKIAEQELLAALSLPMAYDKNPFSPSWGVRDIYRLLVSLYEANNDENNLLKYSRQMIENNLYDAETYTIVINYYFKSKNEPAIERYALEAIRSPLSTPEKESFYRTLINHYIRIADQENTKRSSIEALKIYPKILPWLKERPKKFPQQATWLQFVNDLKASR
jgi:hypothetical protein